MKWKLKKGDYEIIFKNPECPFNQLGVEIAEIEFYYDIPTIYAWTRTNSIEITETYWVCFVNDEELTIWRDKK
jgi:hypothetical protein